MFFGAAAHVGGVASCGVVALVRLRWGGGGGRGGWGGGGGRGGGGSFLNAYAIIASYDTLMGIVFAANGSLATTNEGMFFRAAARGAFDAFVRVLFIATVAGNGCDSQREEEQDGGFVHFHNAR